MKLATLARFAAASLLAFTTFGCSSVETSPPPQMDAGSTLMDAASVDMHVVDAADHPDLFDSSDATLALDATADATLTLDAAPDATLDAAISTDCTHRFEAGEIVLIEPYLEGGVLRMRLAREIDWSTDDYEFFRLEEACIVVAARNIIDGEVLDEILTAPYWDTTTGRTRGNSLWVLDMNHTGAVAGHPPIAGLIVRTVAATAFPEGMDLDLSLGTGPGHFAAWYNPPDELTEPEWVGSSARPTGPRHYPFGTPPGPAVEGHPFTWSFTDPGHYFVRAAVSMHSADGEIEGSGLVHFIVEQPVITPCGICDYPTRFCNETTLSCVQCVVPDDCSTMPRERPPFTAYAACVEGQCVECDDDADCPNRWLARCDLDTNLCEPCVNDETCAAQYPDFPVCVSGACEAVSSL